MKPSWRVPRPGGSTVFIVLGVLSFLVLRQLPPDNSLALVRGAGSINVCHPLQSLPYLDSQDGEMRGIEADLARHIARELKVEINWNLQAGWGQAPDPVDWGLRPESCDLILGGVVRSPETEGLMYTLPYEETRWVLLTRWGEVRELGILANHWGLSVQEAFSWGDRQNLDYTVFDSPHEALAALGRQEYDAVLTLTREARWLHEQLPGWQARAVEELPAYELAVGTWKTRITLKRAVTSAIEGYPACCPAARSGPAPHTSGELK